MADHITEEEQVEAIKKWWKENGFAVIAGLVLGFGALFGWRGWNDYQQTIAGEASVLYSEYQQLDKTAKPDDVKAKAEKIIADYAKTEYAALASLDLAQQSVAINDMTAARGYLQWVIDNSDQPQIIHTARTRLAMVLLNEGDNATALVLLDLSKAGGFTAQYAELRGDVLVAMGDRDAANKAYKLALDSDGVGNQQREFLIAKIADTTPAKMDAVVSPLSDGPSAKAKE